MDEAEFTTEFVIPLLRKVGYNRVRYVHGIDEWGRDVIFFDKDRLGFDVVCACQLKLGDLKGTQKKRIQSDIVPQLLEGLRSPYRDFETGETYRIHRMYLVLSGRIVGTAKQQIQVLTEKEPNIFVVDKQNLDVFAGGDGYETEFLARTLKGNNSRFIRLSRNPRLPILSSGSWLEIGLYIDTKNGHCTDLVQILETSYDPLNRVQQITILVPTDEEEVTDELEKLVRDQLEEFFAYHGELLDYGL